MGLSAQISAKNLTKAPEKGSRTGTDIVGINVVITYIH